MMFVIKMTCWDYPTQISHTEYVLEGNKPMEFETKSAAMATLLSCVIEEANDLNFSPNTDGTIGTDRRKFIPDLNGDHDCIIRAWDGDDYMNVTAYDVVIKEEEDK